MLITFDDNGMKHKRNCIVRSFSFRPGDTELFSHARQRVKEHLPSVNDSELVRLAIEVVTLSPEALIRRVATTLEQVKAGRPPALVPVTEVSDAWEEELRGDEGRLRRLALFEELEMLREGPRGEAHVEARIETLCRYFGMVYCPPR